MEPKNEEIKGIKIGEVEKTREKRPCYFFQDVLLPKPTKVSYLTFRNYYTAYLTIKYKKPGKDRFDILVEKHTLVKHPHYEDHSQDYHVLDLSNDFKVNLGKEDVIEFRFNYYQPSPNWRSFNIREIKFYSRVWKVKQIERIEILEEKKSHSVSKKKAPTTENFVPHLMDREESLGKSILKLAGKVRQYNEVLVDKGDEKEVSIFPKGYEEITTLIV